MVYCVHRIRYNMMGIPILKGNLHSGFYIVCNRCWGKGKGKSEDRIYFSMSNIAYKGMRKNFTMRDVKVELRIKMKTKKNSYAEYYSDKIIYRKINGLSMKNNKIWYSFEARSTSNSDTAKKTDNQKFHWARSHFHSYSHSHFHFHFHLRYSAFQLFFCLKKAFDGLPFCSFLN